MPTVLLIEDEEALLGNLARFLRSFAGESRVLTSTSGEDGLRSLAAEPGIDVLVTDVFLPGIDGLEVVRRAGRARPELPVVVTTAFGSDAVRRVAAAHGVSRFIDKPIDLDDFRAAILSAAVAVPEEVSEAAELGLAGAMRTLVERGTTALLCYRSGPGSGSLVLSNGVLTGCTTEIHEGLEALETMLAWPRGRLRRVATWGRDLYARNIDLPPPALLTLLG